MKNIYLFSVSALTIVLIALSVKVIAQGNNIGWTAKLEYPKAFIENKGQFPVIPNDKISKDNILYAVDNGPTKIYFTKNGVIYNLIQAIDKKEEAELEKEDNVSDAWKEKEEKEQRKEYKSDVISFTWENSNSDVEVITEDLRTDYYSYSFIENKEVKNINFIKGYKKIIYKNLYPNVDVEYSFHPIGGIKYALILHPGADVSKIKMIYTDPLSLMTDGNLHISTLFGDIIDHAPETYYAENSSLSIKSYFIITGNTIGFALDSYDNSKSVTIDPWTQTPTLTNSNCVWECERDGAGNVYIIGGDVPMKLQKYDPAGNFVWTYVTPWDTTSSSPGADDGEWLGTLATDLAGNSYVTNGSTAELEKINTGGGMVYHVNGGPLDEYWNIAFNCDQTKLIIGGTRLSGSFIPPNPGITGSGVIYDINTINGSVNSLVYVGNTFTYTVLGFPSVWPNEVRSITSSYNARYYYLTLDSIGAIDQNFGACPNATSLLKIPHGYMFSYKCENYRPDNGNAGIMAIRANRYYVYTQNGATLHRRSLATGAVINSVAIPGGINNSVALTSPTVYQAGNSGIDIDSCGFVYVGSGNAIIKYDADLNFITSVATSYKVYDVAVSTGGNVIFCGGTGDNSTTTRTGYIQSANMSACDPPVLYCCDANICPVDTVCSTDAAFNLTSSSPGGTWSGTGITNTSLGTFDPSVSGAGTFTITYTQACGTGTVTIQVNACATLSICQEANGDLTVTGGTGPYSWDELVPGTPTPITNSAECTACGYTWFVFQCLDGSMNVVTDCPGSPSWSNFATGITVTPPVGADTIQVTDASLNSTVIYNISSLPPCSTCTANVTASNVVNVLCYGASTGSFTANGAGVSPYDYTLMLGVTTIATYPNVSGSQNFTGLAAGTYTLNIVDDSSCTGTIQVIITQPASAVTATVSVVTPPSCGMSDGSATASGSGGTGGPYTYSWNSSPVQNTQTAVNLPAGNYTVTVYDASSCTATNMITLTNPNAPALVTSTVNATCGMSNGQATVTPSGGTAPYAYVWNTVPPQTTQTATGLAPGTYYVTVTDDLNCTGIDSATVVDTSSFSADAGPNQSICLGDSTTLTATGGTIYQWSTGGSTASINVLPSVTTSYTVTVSDATCTATDIVTVTVNPIPTANITGDTLICNGASAILTASGGSSFVWNTSDTTAAITVSPLSPTTYNVTVSNAGCSSTADITINLSTPPTANAGNDTTINIGGSAQLDGSGGLSYSWSPIATLSCSNCADPLASPLSTTTYVLVVTDANGCTDADTVIVTVDMNCGEVFVPNAFSPNSDGQNELECVYGNCIQTMEFAIYDRWGEKVFETTDPKECWDGRHKGKELNTGVFVYYMKSTLYNGAEVKKQGNINLFR